MENLIVQIWKQPKSAITNTAKMASGPVNIKQFIAENKGFFLNITLKTQ